MANKTIKIGSCDFWPGFNLSNSIFYDIIVKCGYTPVIDNINPDILFYSVMGNTHYQYKVPIKIWFSGENWRLPNFDECNFALSGYYLDDPRHFRLPLYVIYVRNYIVQGKYLKAYTDLSLPRDINVMKPKTKFCNFIYSNCNSNQEGVKFRQYFFHELSKYKQVDSGGGCFNNIGKRVSDKILFMQNYKFSIAMENSNQMNGIYGYTTEKILDAFLAGTVPIYWGNPYIGKDFNPKAFINYHDFNDINRLIEYIIQVDNDDKLYQQYLSEPIIIDFYNSPINLDHVVKFFSTFL